MKIHSDNDTVIERTGLGSDGAFGIVFNAKMARILSDGIYSNKPEAICRELGCNALDSHVMAGIGDTPIEIHLPTTLEPWFHVRDQGLGLDHEDVINIFTVYGESTKTHTNDAVGQLGLGSKVPFAYCDAFDVVARKDGIERHYSMYKNEKGLPSCARLLEQPTTETNGVTVKMPVPSRDFSVFRDSALNVYRWFPVKPVFTGINNFTVPDVNYSINTPKWGMRKMRDTGYGSNKIHALMGPVAYPVDVHACKGLSDHIRHMAHFPLVLRFEIGELDMAVSREALSYDERTQKALKDRLNLVFNELRDHVGKSIQDAPTLWQAHMAWNETFNDRELGYDYSRLFGQGGIMWQGGKLVRSSTLRVKIHDLYPSTDIKTQTAVRLLHLRRGYKSPRWESYYETIDVVANENTVLVFDDLDSGTAGRIRKLAEDRNENVTVWCFGASPEKTWDEMRLALGNAPVVMASSLAKKVTPRVKTEILRYNPAWNKKSGPSAWVQDTVDLEEGGYYVKLYRWDVMNPAGTEPLDFGTIMDMANSLGIKFSTPIYAARDASMKKAMADDSSWIDVLDHIREQVAAKLTPEMLKLMTRREEYAEARKRFYDETLWKNAWSSVDSASPWRNFMRNMLQLQRDAQTGGQIAAWIQLANLLGMDINNQTPSSGILEQANELDTLYPMVRSVAQRWISQETLATLAEYVNHMDELRNLRQQICPASEPACA